jgi:hypothetical protein
MADDPGRIFAELLSRQQSSVDEPTDRRPADCKSLCSLVERRLTTFEAFSWEIDRNLLLAALVQTPILSAMWNDIVQRIQMAANLQIRIEARFAPEPP